MTIAADALPHPDPRPDPVPAETLMAAQTSASGTATWLRADLAARSRAARAAIVARTERARAMAPPRGAFTRDAQLMRTVAKASTWAAVGLVALALLALILFG